MWEKLLRKNIVSVPPEWPQAIDPQEASVLVLMAHHPGQEDFQIVLTKRTQKVLHHKGQISFPGGVPEKEDPHLLATALRETHEEIGVPSEAIEILGMLDPVVTGFQV
ncbi:MAG: CoA pyrophosphatase, partial [Proteobacteria bacterium]|nr:CoA pyrophosphatase [Pseudomonadota bacterium]